MCCPPQGHLSASPRLPGLDVGLNPHPMEGGGGCSQGGPRGALLRGLCRLEGPPAPRPLLVPRGRWAGVLRLGPQGQGSFLLVLPSCSGPSPRANTAAGAGRGQCPRGPGQAQGQGFLLHKARGPGSQRLAHPSSPPPAVPRMGDPSGCRALAWALLVLLWVPTAGEWTLTRPHGHVLTASRRSPGLLLPRTDRRDPSRCVQEAPGPGKPRSLPSR